MVVVIARTTGLVLLNAATVSIFALKARAHYDLNACIASATHAPTMKILFDY
jgi:hypothetical protein